MYLSTITLNISGLNAPIKRHTVADWTIKQESALCRLRGTDFRAKDTETGSKGMGKGVSCKGGTRKQGHTLTSDRTGRHQCHKEETIQ